MTQFFQQRLRLLQVFRVKPLSEPAVNLRQHLSGIVLLPLLLPQSGQAHRRPQLQRLRALVASNLDGFEKTLLGFCLGVRDEGLGIGNFGFAFDLSVTCLGLV